MPFDVFAGTVTDPEGALDPHPHVTQDDDHRVALAPGQLPVFVNRSGQNVTATLEADDAAQRHSARSAIVYINESGRHVTLVPTGAAASGPAVVAPPDEETTVGHRADVWRVIPAEINTPDHRVEEAFRADVRDANGSGPYTFKLSRQGRDRFIVIFEPGGSATSAEYIVVTVRKRITCHYRRMVRPASSTGGDPGHYDLTDVHGTNVLDSVRRAYLSRFGIELDNLAAPESDMSHEATLAGNHSNGGAAYNHLVPSNRRGGRAPDREMWIGAIAKLTVGGVELTGLGGRNAALVALEDMLVRDLAAFASWHNQPSLLQDAQFAALPDEDKPAFRELALGNVSPEDMCIRNASDTLFHEIGHVLGMVPTSGDAAGFNQRNWHDAAHSGHCATRLCVMGSGVENSFSALVRDPADEPFCGMDESIDPVVPDSKCALYLANVDLSNVNAL
jgi:hypothetical protein